MAAVMKHMASNFAKLEKFEGVDFKRWQKKMHFLLSGMSVVYVLTTPIPEDGGDNPTMEQVRMRAKWDNDDYVCRGLILNGMSDSLFDVYQNVETSKELWYTLEAKYMAEDALNLKHTLKHLKEELTLIELGSHMRIKESLRAQDNDKPKGNNVAGPSVVNKVERNNSSRYNDNKGKRKHHDTIVDPNKKPKVTCWKCGKPGHLKKDCKAGNVGNKANGSGTKGSVDGSSNPLKGQNMFNKSLHIYYVTYVSEAYFVQNDDVAWWVDSRAIVHVCKDRSWFKTYESLNDGYILYMGNKSATLVHGRGCVDLRFSSRKVVSLLNVLHVPNIRKNLVSSSHARLGHVHFKRMQDMSKDGLISAFDMDTEKCKTCMLTKITKKPFQNVKHETEVLELIHGDLCDLHATPSLGNKKYFVTFIDDASRFCFVYLLYSKDEALDKFKVFKTEVELQQGPLIKRFKTDKGRVVVRLSDPKLKTLGEKGIECIFVGYAEHSKAFRFYVIEPNESVVINSIIESRDAIFDDNRFSSVPRPSQRSLVNGTEDFGGSVILEKVTDEMDSIMGNNTWVLADLPPGCRPVGCKWIFKRKLKVDGTIEKFKASLIIHQMDVKTAFLDGELEEEVYMNQPQGFIMPGNENKVCKLIKSLYGPKQAPKQWHQKFDEVVLSNGYLLNQANKCVYSKFDETSKGVVICLYVDDMLIFDTDQDQVDLTKEFLSSRFSMKDMGEADVILGIRIKHESNEIAISQSHYIEKLLKKFNYFDCTPLSTPMDTSEKLMPNNGQAVSQLEYFRVIGCLMYAMTCTRPGIAFVVGKLSMYTSNPDTQHWQAIQRVLKYLKKTMNYRLMYTGYPSVLEGYTDASWISNTEDNSSTSGWVFLLGGGAISWASKKQTCITSSTMESKFVALAAVGKEAEWLKNLLLEIPLWVKPIAPISIRCDSAATLAKAYSQMYNGKSRHLGVRHSMIRELITNGVIPIEFVRSQQNLADHVMKGLARDFFIKSAKWMGLKSN
ncbi:zinc finger, CCHC-type containing protein [Tanacetum coccineum]